MKHIPRLFMFMLLQSFAASAATINTDLFSIEVPDQWRIEDNKTSIVLAMGSKTVSGPFLSIQYCVAEEPSKLSNLRRCDKPCSETSLDFLFNEKSQGPHLSPVTTQTKPNGVVEYSTETATPDNGVAFATLVCSNSAQAYISLVSDQPKSASKETFSKILGSLKWK